MGLQDFETRFHRELSALGYRGKIVDGRLRVAKVVADQAAHDALVVTLKADHKTMQKERTKRAWDDDNMIAVKALGLLVLDALNFSRGQHGLADVTPAQFKTQFLAKVDSIS